MLRTHPHTGQNVVCELAAPYEIFLQHFLIAERGDFVFEEMHVVLIIPFVAQMLFETEYSSHVFDGARICVFERFLLV